MSSDRLLLPVLLLLSACCVKENRESCPCILTLDLSALPVTPVILSVMRPDYGITKVVHTDTLFTFSVPKGVVDISAVGGALADEGGGVRIPEGEEAPPLYLFHASIPTDSERVDVPVILHKQFCRLDLTFSGPPGYGPPFDVQVQGFSDGWFVDGSPSSGPFSVRLHPEADGRASLRLPRQGDDSLLLHIVFSDQVVRTFALGHYIAEAGYDWTAPDLEDLSLQVDISLTAVTISTDAWTRTEEIELRI